ncbi:MAG: 5'-methylthioadenosine/adenosylhomocysteine nucleosidase [Lactobacillaceae bacterium]|jgi:adenosylhomocysteine nucleosidase|nr:5'-methylthioadenosine/adenosylhomocysteine nucleosidase [Lactobacillaceae bacterium]
MKIGIITPMEEEKRRIVEKLSINSEAEYAGQIFTEGFYQNNDVILTESGIGKVQAALAATLLIEKYNIDLLINTGSAGALNQDLEVGDTVIGTTTAYHDADNTAFGYQYGQMPKQPLFFDSDIKTIQKLIEIEPDIKSGLIVSGDSFVNGERKHQILKYFPNALAVEMESAAIAQVALQFKKPFVVIRSISDKADGGASESFDEFVVTAGIKSADLLLKFMDN